MSNASSLRLTGTQALLSGTAAFWFTTVAIGQAIFALYIGLHYGGSAIRGDWEAWTQSMIHGIVQGDLIGNLAVMAHILLAFIMTVAGPLQLIPFVRRRWPRFHRVNGRVYLTTAVIISLGGLYMVWSRGVLGPISNALAISLNGALMIWFAVQAFRHAVTRRIDIHRRWATRLFLAASGVWFFRVGMMLWILINGGPVGIGSELDGPFAVTWAFGQYLLPLALYEAYLWAQAKAGAGGRLAMSALLVVAALGVISGVAMATLFMWGPRVWG